MVGGGVCVVFLLGTISYSLSAPDPLDAVNININLGEGTNTGQSHDNNHDYSQAHGNGNGPYPPIQFQDTISGAGLSAGVERGLSGGVERYRGQGYQIPRIKIDDAHPDTSSFRICKEKSVRECVRIIVNGNDMMNAEKLILPNGEMITDGETTNLYRNSKYADYRWREKPNQFQLKNPRVYKTSNGLEAIFSETDGVVTANVPSLNNIIYEIDYCGAGCHLWIKYDTTGWVDDDVDTPRTNPGRKNRYSRRGKYGSSRYGGRWNKFQDYQITKLQIGDDPVEVSAMVYYTKEYARMVYNESSNESLFQQQKQRTERAFDRANKALELSKIPIRFKIHCFEEVAIVDGQTAWKSVWDIYKWKNLTEKENRKSADVAVLFPWYLSDKCGFAYFQYAVVAGYCLPRNDLAHELGHLLGALHNVEEVERNTEFPYRHGLLSVGNFHTLMSYISKSNGNEIRVDRFSQPGMYWNGWEIGNETSANNARYIREYGGQLSKKDNEAIPCRITGEQTQPTSDELPAEQPPEEQTQPTNQPREEQTQPTNQPSSGCNEYERQSLEATNRRRQMENSGLNNLVCDESICREVKAFARELGNLQRMVHAMDLGRDLGTHAENLHQHPSKVAPDVTIESWYSEKFKAGCDQTANGPCGHYNNMVNPDYTRMCMAADNGGGTNWYAVARYRP